MSPDPLLRCPHCKGALTAARERLACEACRRSFPLLDDIPDLRREPGTQASGATTMALAPETDRAERRRAQRILRCVRAARGDLPRQGVLAHLGPRGAAALVELHDSFRTLVALDSSLARLLALRNRLHAAGIGNAVLAVGDPDALPLATQSIDLFSSSDAPGVRGCDPGALADALHETHRVLRERGSAYVAWPAPWRAVLSRTARGHQASGSRYPGPRIVELAARQAFADGHRVVTPGLTAVPGWNGLASIHRHVQALVGFEYTLGRGTQAPRRPLLASALERLAATHELVCWRVRPNVEDGKRPPSDEPMTFGRFHFPESAPAP